MKCVIVRHVFLSVENSGNGLIVSDIVHVKSERLISVNEYRDVCRNVYVRFVFVSILISITLIILETQRETNKCAFSFDEYKYIQTLSLPCLLP